MNAAHTPGPWRVSPTDRCTTSVLSAHGLIAHVYGCIDGANQARNAALIAEAPELLAVLNRIGNWALRTEVSMPVDLIEDVREVMARAEGRS